MNEVINYKYKTKPFKHQAEAMYKLYGKEAFGIFGEQGTGKTKIAIDIACNLFLEGKIDAVLLIAPNQVHTQWANEQIPEHSCVRNHIKVWNTKSSRVHRQSIEDFIDTPEFDMKLKWFCVNVETFSSLNHINKMLGYLKNHRVFTIVDEATRIKNPDANRSYNICYMLGRFKRKAKSNAIIKSIPLSKYRTVLTGTIITNSPFDLWGMFEFLKFRYFGIDYMEFKARYGIEIRDYNEQADRNFSRKIRPDEIETVLKLAEGGYIDKKGEIAKPKEPDAIAYIMGISLKNVNWIIANPNNRVPYKRLDELKRAIEPISFIVRKKDCLDLPPKIYEKLIVELNAEQKRIYKELVKQMMSEYDGDRLNVLAKVAVTGRLQQVTGGFFPYKDHATGNAKIKPITSMNPKIRRLKEDLEEAGDEVVIIWAQFVGEIKLLGQALTKAFPDKVTKIYYGKVSPMQRTRIINDFKNGQVQYLVANPRTAGIGLNFQNCSFQYFYSNNYSLEDRVQAEDRSHRIGITRPVLYKDIIAKGTIDEKIFDIVKQKKNLLEYFRDPAMNFEKFISLN